MGRLTEALLQASDAFVGVERRLRARRHDAKKGKEHGHGGRRACQ